MATVGITANVAGIRDEAIRLARAQVTWYLQEEAPHSNIAQLRFLLGELLKNTIDHNDHGAQLELEVRHGVLTFIHIETRPDCDLDALAARMVAESSESRLAGNGVNQGSGFTLLRGAADGLGLSLTAALPGRTIQLTAAGYAAGAERAERLANVRSALVFVGYGAVCSGSSP